MPHELSSEMRAALDDQDIREAVSHSVRRRVPGDDAPDVAQAVFCDALDSKTGPAHARQIPFWLAGVARHAAADYFRRRPREVLSRDTDAAGPPEAVSLPPRFEVREAISRVLDSLGEGAKKTLFWMVLESEGVELKSIAKEEQMSPAAVRARVYRLRRTLRRELAYLLLGALILACAAEVLRTYRREPVAIVPPAPSASAPVPNTIPPVDLRSVRGIDPSPESVVPRPAPVAPVPLPPPSASTAPRTLPAPSTVRAPVVPTATPPLPSGSPVPSAPPRSHPSRTSVEPSFGGS
jgi:DNA-directed RNA polymerase specialized sigma24 family protein